MLHGGDFKLINEIIESQKEIRLLYHPNYVWPIFDKAMTEMLNNTSPPPKIIWTNRETKKTLEKKIIPKKILFLFHQYGPLIGKVNQTFFCTEGIARVVRLMFKVLIDNGHEVIITTYRKDFSVVYGYFFEVINDANKLKLMVFDNTRYYEYFFYIKKLLINLYKKIQNSIILAKLIGIIRKVLINFHKKIQKTQILPNINGLKTLLHPLHFSFKVISFILKTIIKLNTRLFIRNINKDPAIKLVFVPHYYINPEALWLKKTIFLFLPDYLPHFYKGSKEMGDSWASRKIGKKLTKKAKLIYTTSKFTKNYLPKTVLKIDQNKITTFPLPYLNQHIKKKDLSLFEFINDLPKFFVFFPTRDRTSKRLIDFVKTIEIVNERLKSCNQEKRIYGILTAPISWSTNKYIIILPQLPDQVLIEVYRLASALLFTSENEGNFPTQILEALHLETPILATKIPQITTELDELAESLQLVNVGDCETFANKILYIIEYRKKILESQKKVKVFVEDQFSYSKFSANLLNFLATSGFKQVEG